MHSLYTARDFIEASLLLDLLKQQNIQAKINNAYQTGGVGELAVSYPEVWIKHERDLQNAKNIIQQFEQRQQTPTGTQICTACQEPNPETFDFCWSCQTDLH